MAAKQASTPASPSTNGHQPVSIPPTLSTDGPQPISLSEFRTNGRKLAATWEGYDQPVEFVYKPGVLDSAHYDKLREDEPLPISEWTVKYCLRVLAAIPSFTEDDGEPLAITDENLRKIPTGLLNAMINAISEDLRPKETPESSSNGSSTPAATKE